MKYTASMTTKEFVKPERLSQLVSSPRSFKSHGFQCHGRDKKSTVSNFQMLVESGWNMQTKICDLRDSEGVV